MKVSKWVCLCMMACGAESVKAPLPFGQPQPRGKIENGAIREASGLASGINNEGMLWTHNDSGNEPVIYLMDEYGRHQNQFFIAGVQNRDWEDIATGPGPDSNTNYIYIAETGDNRAVYEHSFIYRFEEPTAADRAAIENFDIITFTYPNGPRDAECLMIDPLTKDLFIISKREPHVSLYRLEYPQKTGDTVVIQELGSIPFHNIVAGDISADGRYILLKTYEIIYFWKRKNKAGILETLQSPPVELPYKREPQGEAIAWQKDARGFFTLSEAPAGVDAILIFYPEE